MNVALEQPIVVAAALLASAEGYTPTAQQLIDRARERIGTIHEVANALADNLPQPKSSSGKRRRRKKRKKEKGAAAADTANGQNGAGDQVQPGSDAPAEMQGEVELDEKPGSPRQSSQRRRKQQPMPAEHNGAPADADEAAAQVATAVGSAPAERGDSRA